MGKADAEFAYEKAVKLGLKESASLQAQGRSPYPLVLDELLDVHAHMEGSQYIGLVDIPVERIVGTKSAGRTTAFSASFYPLADSESEFGRKWIALCEIHMGEEGIRDPIMCYEYLGNFYVLEGNKRLSVLRYFGAARIPGIVYRILPQGEETEQVKAYREFLEFYKYSKVYDVQFSWPGSYEKLLTKMGIPADREWSEDVRRRFRAYFHYFREAFAAMGGEQLHVKPEEAMLLWLQVHEYRDLGAMSGTELKKSLAEMWNNVVAMDTPAPMVRTEAPATEAKLNLFEKMVLPHHVNVAFIHQRDDATSPWTNAHDLGRQYLEKALGDAVTVRSYFRADTDVQAEALMEQAVADGAEVIFATTPQLIGPCLKVSVRHPKVRFLNCSVHMPYSTVHTYYSRIYEAKFITGAIAGAIADNNHIGYVGSYPIYGVPASINAFALGAKMTNPRAKIELKWSCLPGDPVREFLDAGVQVISNRDNPVEDSLYPDYGTYQVQEDGSFLPLGSPVWIWGKFYENVIRSILMGTWDIQDKGLAVNDWWGLDSGVIDITLSEKLPEGVRALAMLLRESLQNGALDPFRREIYSQDGILRNDGTAGFDVDALLQMDWLCDNVIGQIPEEDQLLPISLPTVKLLGIRRTDVLPE